ncbi:hypothetical protein [Shewanella algidipiscicola]|uniref:Methyl-accepting chemotaxis protein n=1 Tax=Shewanella algidipiscicola TaxID=614070 RepID=A0ABQ4PG45_9GAMM|nr:hypothetical protein [Shewanella algidipiscicola]GIU46489.1 hypothetical protein TUM4630_17120 [Shewanella algidipiscicola]
MNLDAILDFLIPDISDPLQAFFLSIILFMMLCTIVSAHLIAKPKSWEKKWHRGTPNDTTDDLDIEHGSVTDLWHAVATAPEKLVELMPGLLLIIGLLGTFLGLGMALNHASNILSQPNALDASSAADSMQHLLGLLNGLGTKFKTSTWGISGFILLKIWSEFARFDEKRLTWVIDKVKNEIEHRKSIQLAMEDEKQAALFSQISSVSVNMASAFSNKLDQLLEQNKQNNSQNSQLLSDNFDSLEQCINQAHLSTQNESKNNSLQLQEVLKNTNDQTRTCVETGILTLVNKSTEVQKHTSETLRAGLNDIKNRLTQVHQQTQKSINNSINGLQETIESVRIETQATKEAMQSFTDNSQSVIENMAGAAQRMAQGADKVGLAASDLVNAVDSFNSQFTEVLDNVRSDLSSAIKDMSSEASLTLERGSTQLGKATLEISTALGVLSTDVKETMGDVKTSIDEALHIQKKAAVEFTLSSNVLNESIAMSTEIVSKLGKPIEAGLSAISTSGQQMRSIGESLKRNETALEQVIGNLANLPAALEPLQLLSSHQSHLLSSLKPLDTLLVQQHEFINEVKLLRQDAAEHSASVKANQLILSDTLDMSVQRADQIVSYVSELSSLLAYLKEYPDSQQQLLSILSPISEIPINQQLLLGALEDLKLDLFTKDPGINSEVA